jgi:hypothetical protein
MPPCAARRQQWRTAPRTVLTPGAWGGRGHPAHAVAQTAAHGGAAQKQPCAFAARSKLQKGLIMEKATHKDATSTWKTTAEEASNLILLHSWDRMLPVKGPRQSEHKAYMALAVAIDEAIKAFIALDESLK